jgi:flagellar biosynthesis protein FlhF
MLLKRIEAKTMPEALERVRAECGDDALVVETRATKGGYLIVAARPETAVPTPAPRRDLVRDQAGSTSLLSKWTRGFQPLADKATDFGLSATVLRAVEKALLGTRVDMSRPGDPALPNLAARVLAALVRTEPRVEAAEDAFRTLAVVGPTGVGKTTTLAKLAAEWRVARGLKVGLVAADAFRVGAFEQLRTYARIIDAPVRAADGRSSAVDALAALSECDVVLVDTPGRSHRDGGRIGEIADLLGALRPDETHLVLPGSASTRTLAESATAFAAVRPSRIVLSKLDESEGLGALVGAVRSSGVPVSWFTTGQEVPDDIERADARRFAERLLGNVEDGAA